MIALGVAPTDIHVCNLRAVAKHDENGGGVGAPSSLRDRASENSDA